MIELMNSGSILEINNVDNFNMESVDIENIELNQNFDTGFNLQKSSEPSSLPNTVVEFMVNSKNSLIQKSQDVHNTYLEDKDFSFKDKVQLLEKTYSYQLEMTFYNTFMSQTLQKVDALIQLK